MQATSEIVDSKQWDLQAGVCKEAEGWVCQPVDPPLGLRSSHSLVKKNRLAGR